MARRNSLDSAFCDTRTADEEGYVDIFLNAAAFSRREAVLRDVEAVVCCVNQVSIFKNLWGCLQTCNDGIDELVHRLQRL